MLTFLLYLTLIPIYAPEVHSYIKPIIIIIIQLPDKITPNTNNIKRPAQGYNNAVSKSNI
jgi:hypothetical protein